MTTARPYPLPVRTNVLGLVGAAGAMLLILGALSDRLEADLGLGALNLALSAPVALLATCLGALLGDTMLTALAGRSRWRPSRHSAMTALIILGAIASTWLLASHLSRPIRLDGWIALAGGVLLMIAGLGHHPPIPSRSATAATAATAATPGRRQQALHD